MRIFMAMNWHEYFTYDEATGSLIWKSRPRHHFKTDGAKKRWDTQFAGTVAGSKFTRTNSGKPKCIMVNVCGKNPGAHKIIWEMHNGPIPLGMEIDHINLDPWDNRRSNLRLATHMQNMANQAMRRNRTGYKGVTRTRTGRYQSGISTKHGKRMLGTFGTPEEAHAAYVRAAIEKSGEFARP